MTQVTITKIIDRIGLVCIINKIEKCGLVEAKRKVDTMLNCNTKPLINVPDKYLIKLKTICEFTTESKRYNMEKHQFKPFDQVLVRMDYRLHKCMNNEPRIWYAALFSHIEKENGSVKYCANSILWDECIPYNENTAHLLGTNEPYKEPEPKVWHVTDYKNSVKSYYFTNTEFEQFIKTAVINNQDVINFNVNKIERQ